jgi:transcription elongation factor Elf1
MFECPRCSSDQLYRVNRRALERMLFTQSYQCRICGYRAHVARPVLATIIDLLRSAFRRRVVNRPGMSKES